MKYPRLSASGPVQLGAGVNVVVRGPKLVKVHQPSETEMGEFMGGDGVGISLIEPGGVLYIRVLGIKVSKNRIYSMYRGFVLTSGAHEPIIRCNPPSTIQLNLAQLPTNHHRNEAESAISATVRRHPRSLSKHRSRLSTDITVDQISWAYGL